MQKLKNDIKCYTLDKILDYYNWDDGFELPLEIIHHPNCELATALKAFYLANGELYLQDQALVSKPTEWLNFLKCLYERIISGCYSGKYIGFEIPLTKVQKYKLLKAVPEIPAVFLEDIIGSKTTERCEQCTFGSNVVTTSEFKDFCPDCDAADSLVVEMDGVGYSLSCKNCGYHVATTFFRPCYVNDTTPREEFSKYNGCRYRI